MPAQPVPRGHAEVSSLETRRLGMVFPGATGRAVVALRAVDLRVAEGSIHAVVGPRGAGKTTLLNVLSGYLAPTTGQILVRGRDVTGQQPEQLARLGVGRSFRLSTLFDQLTGLEQVELALAASSADHRRWLPRLQHGRFRAGAEDLLDRVGLSGRAAIASGSLAPGERRALEVAVALAPSPWLLMLDEPTAGLGPHEVERTVALVSEVAAARTLVVVDHHLDAVRRVADTVTVLRAGEVVAEGTYDQVRTALEG
jgi:branched-chain amino acid transport system ATP-binding protein